MKLLKLLGNVYLSLGLFVLLCLFIHDCLVNDKFLLHFIGIFLVIPALAYCSWRLSKDTEYYIKQTEHTQNAIRRFCERLTNRVGNQPDRARKWLLGFSEIRLVILATLRQVHTKIG